MLHKLNFFSGVYFCEYLPNKCCKKVTVVSEIILATFDYWNAQCVTWYDQICSIPQAKRIYRTTYKQKFACMKFYPGIDQIVWRAMKKLNCASNTKTHRVVRSRRKFLLKFFPYRRKFVGRSEQYLTVARNPNFKTIQKRFTFFRKNSKLCRNLKTVIKQLLLSLQIIMCLKLKQTCHFKIERSFLTNEFFSGKKR